MNDTRFPRIVLAVFLLVAALPAQAHRAWLLPSATVLSGDEPWLTVDAAVSNDLFYFEHQPMRFEGLEVIAPDGAPAKMENRSTGRYRSTFDVRLDQKGTYKVSRVTDTVTASYRIGGELQRFRGSAAAFAAEVPAGATDVRVAKNRGRIETFVTSGNPTDAVLQPTGAGLELVPLTHPNDLFAGETAQFRFVLDGKPAAGLEVTVIPGGIRYRDRLGEMKYVTGQDGRFSIDWQAPGLYWMNATASTGARRQGGAAPAAATPVEPGERASYAATLEVLPQ